MNIINTAIYWKYSELSIYIQQSTDAITKDINVINTNVTIK